MSKTYSVVVQQLPDNGDYFIEFPDEMIKEVGWKVGDEIDWHENEDGSFLLTKVPETEYVLVECVSTFRQRYMVEVPKGRAEWALDTVAMDEATDFSQEHLGEQIMSHRVVTKKEALALSDADNDYTMDWDEASKMRNFFTPWTAEMAEKYGK